MFLLDTNACIQILNKTSPLLVKRLRRHEPWEIHLSSVVKGELLYGAWHSGKVTENLHVLADFFSPFPCLPFDDPCADHYGQIRAFLARAGTLIGPNDMLIAATARAHGLVLVTHNVDEFSRVPDLQFEDWEE
jgi:tRNA(fMet)-specific endonuclease VapC